MNSNVLRASLIKSAVFLAVISLLVYLTAASPEGNFWASLGTLFMAMIRIVQLSLGLVVALVFCLAVLTGIFLGCVAMVSRESAANMVEPLRQQISDKLLFIRTLVIRDFPAGETQVVPEYGEGLKIVMLHEIDDSLASLRTEQSAVLEKIAAVNLRVDNVEKRTDGESISHLLGQQDALIQGFSVALDTVQKETVKLQAKIDEFSGQLSSEEPGRALENLGRRMEELQKSNVSLQEEFLQIKKVVHAGGKYTKKDTPPDEGLVEHRLFAHLKSKAMQEKVESLVTKTLDTKMSYAHVIDHLVKQTKGKTAEIIGKHPSLAKEYIRYRRNNR